MKTSFSILLIFLFTYFFAQEDQKIAAMVRKSIADEITSFHIAPTPVAKTEDKVVMDGSNSIKIRLYYPEITNKKLPVIFQIHGGALVGGDLNTHDNICRYLSAKTNSIVVAIDYKRPPEYPYPTGLNECDVVLSWILKTASQWNGDAKHLTLLGDSGGALLATSLLVKEQGKKTISNVVLVNPPVDLRDIKDFYYNIVAKMYLKGKSHDDPIISPILAKDISFSPSTLVITCEKDMLKPQGIAWYEKLKKANVEAKLVDVPNEDHLGGLWSAAHPKAQVVMDAVVDFIKSK